MTAGQGMLVEVKNLSKVFSRGKEEIHAVTELSFVAKPGRVTGFLGPNGAGKTTSLRCLLELVTPSSGEATFNGKKYSDLTDPAKLVGVSLGFTGLHPGRSAYKHLLVFATAAGIDEKRIEEVLELVGLTNAKNRKAGSFSTGMKQRLSLATALLGDPEVLILDEPVNGLDPEGIVEVRHLLRNLAAQGKTILLSSHVLSEVQQTVDDVVIIAKGKKVKECALQELIEDTRPVIHVVTPTPEKFNAFTGGQVNFSGDRVSIYDTSLAIVGNFAFTNNIELHELSEELLDLEQVFLELTGDRNV
jgi:ABC-2 type transport system ATP-binding protein